MKIIDRRLCKLEDQFRPADRKPRQCLRMVVRRLGCKRGFENETCSRTLWPDGILFELVWLDISKEGRGTLTGEELDRFVASFPIKACATERAR